ncbi:hypothetical protein PZA11_001784 [Diplocarpon coronariae]
MAPHSRPPLTSRIRASIETRRKSFDGLTHKLSRSGRTSTDGLRTGDGNLDPPAVLSPDQEALRSAVDAAINGEAFQSAIAANLARLVKPSIKSALDTIQPVVEAVYRHELLLRKTNQSLEDVLSRMNLSAEAEAGKRESIVDASFAPPGATPDGQAAVSGEGVDSRALGPETEQFKALLEEHCARTGERVSSLETILESNGAKVGEVVQSLADVQALLEPTREGVETLVSSSGETHTTTDALQAQLEQLKADIASIREAVGTDLGKNIQTLAERSGLQGVSLLSVSEHTTKLDMIASDLAALKSHTDTAEKMDSMSSDIASLKTLVETSSSSTAENLTTVLSSLSEQDSLLGDLKSAPAHPGILSALQQSSDSHAAALQELSGKAASESVVDHSAVLQELRSELEAVKGVILTNGECLTGLGTKIDESSAQFLEMLAKADGRLEGCAGLLGEMKGLQGEHATTLDEIKTAGLNAAPADSDVSVQIAAVGSKLDEHTAALGELKELHSEHSTALESMKSANAEAAPTDSDVGTQITAIVNKLDEHTAALGELKELHSEHSTALESMKSANAEAAPTDSDVGTQITAIVDKLGEHTAAFDQLKGLHSEQCTTLESIKSVHADAAPTGSDFNTKLADIVGKLDEHTAAFGELKGLHGEHSTALEGIKSVNADAAPTGSDVSAQITAIASKLDEHAAALEEIKSFTGSHTAALEAIKSESPDAGADVGAQVTALAAKLDEHTTALGEIKTAGASHSSAFEELKGLHGSHAVALEGIKSVTPEAVPAADTGDISTLIAAIDAKLGEHTAALEDIKGFGAPLEAIKALGDSHASVFEELKALHASLSTALGDFKPASADPTSACESTDLSPQIGDIIAKLETQTAALEEIKGSAALASHGSALEGVRSLAEDVTAEGVLESQIAAVVATLGIHGAALDEIKAHSALLEEIKTSAGAHATALESHGTMLEGIKSLSIAPPTAGDAGIAEIVAKLDAHGAVLDQIKNSAGAHVTALETHGSMLEGIKSLGAAPTPESAGITEVVAKLDSHRAMLNEIKNSADAHATALESHGSSLGSIRSLGVASPAEGDAAIASIVAKLDAHGAVLEEIKGTSGSHSSVLDELKITFSTHSAVLDEIKTATSTHATSDSSLTALEIQIGSIISKLDSHSSAWNELKELTSSSPSPDLASILSTLAQHSTILNEIKEDVSAEILTALHDMGQAHAGHATLLSEIREADVSAEVLTLLHAAADERAGVLGKLDEQGEALQAVREATGRIEEGVKRPEGEGGGLASKLEELCGLLSAIKNSHDIHTSSLDEIKSRSLEAVSPPAIDLTGLETQVGSLATKLEDHNLVLAAIKDSHDVHTTSLDEIKSRSLEPVSTAGPESLEAHIASIATRLDDHSAALSSIRDSHISHTASLDEIKSRAVEPTSTAPTHLVGLETKINSLATKLEDHHAVLAAIKDKTADSHAALGEIRSRVAEPAAGSGSQELIEEIAGIATKLDDHTAMLTTLRDTSGASSESHTAILSEIRDAALAANESHASHTTRLEEIKGVAASSAMLGEIRDAALASVESHSAHTAILSEMKQATCVLTDNSTNQIVTLTEIKDATLASNEHHAAHGAAFAELRTLQTPLVSMDLPAQLVAITETLNSLLEQHRNGGEAGEIAETVATQIEKNQAATNTVVGALGEELKSEITKSGEGILGRFACLESRLGGRDGDGDGDGDGDEGGLSKLGAVLDKYGIELKGVATQLGALDERIEENSKRVLGLCDGVRLNELGLMQMREGISPGVLSTVGAASDSEEGSSVLPVVAGAAVVLAGGAVAAGVLSHHVNGDGEDDIEQLEPAHESAVSLSQDSEAREESAPVNLESVVEKSPDVEPTLEEEHKVEGAIMGDEEVLPVGNESVLDVSVHEFGVEEAVESEPTTEEDTQKEEAPASEPMSSEPANDEAGAETSNDPEVVNADTDIAEDHALVKGSNVEEQLAIDSDVDNKPDIQDETESIEMVHVGGPEESAPSGRQTLEGEVDVTPAPKEKTMVDEQDADLGTECGSAVVEEGVAVKASVGEGEKEEVERDESEVPEKDEMIPAVDETGGVEVQDLDAAGSSGASMPTGGELISSESIVQSEFTIDEGKNAGPADSEESSEETLPIAEGSCVEEALEPQLQTETEAPIVRGQVSAEPVFESEVPADEAQAQALTEAQESTPTEQESLDGHSPETQEAPDPDDEPQDSVSALERDTEAIIDVEKEAAPTMAETVATISNLAESQQKAESQLTEASELPVEETVMDQSPAPKEEIKIQIPENSTEAQSAPHTVLDQNEHYLESELADENESEDSFHAAGSLSLDRAVSYETQDDNAEATALKGRDRAEDEIISENPAERGQIIGALGGFGDERETLGEQDEAHLRKSHSLKFPIGGSAVEKSSSSFTQAPINTNLANTQLASETVGDCHSARFASQNTAIDEQLHRASSFLPVAQQMFQSTDMDSGHATPLDEARSNPFDESDNMLSPSDALSPKSVLSPEDEIDAPFFGQQAPTYDSPQPSYDQGFQSLRLDPVPAASFASPPGMTSGQHHASASEDAISPTSEYGPPGFQDQMQRTQTQELSQDPESGYPAATPSQGQHCAAFSRGSEREGSDFSSPQAAHAPQLSDSDDERSSYLMRDIPSFPDKRQQLLAEPAYESERGGFSEPRRDFLLFSPAGEAPAHNSDDSVGAQSSELELNVPLFPNLGRPVSMQQTYDFRAEQSSGLPLAHRERNIPAAQTYDLEEYQSSEPERQTPSFQKSERPLAAQQNFDSRDEQPHGFQRNTTGFSQNPLRFETKPGYESDSDRSSEYRENVPNSQDLRQEARRDYGHDDERSPEVSREISAFPDLRQRFPMRQDDSDNSRSSDDEWDDSHGFPDLTNKSAMQAVEYDDSRSPDVGNYRPELNAQGQRRTSIVQRRPFEDSYGGFDTEERREAGISSNASWRSPLQPYDDAPTRPLDLSRFTSAPSGSSMQSSSVHSRPLENSRAGFANEQLFDLPSPGLRSPLQPLDDHNFISRGSASHAPQVSTPSRRRIPSSRVFADEDGENDLIPRNLDTHPHLHPHVGQKTRSQEQQLEDGYEHTAPVHDHQEEETGFPDPRFRSPFGPAEYDGSRSRGFDYGDEPPVSSQLGHGSLPAHLQLSRPSPPQLFTSPRRRSSIVDGNSRAAGRQIQDGDRGASTNPFQDMSSAVTRRDDGVAVSRNPFFGMGVGAGEALLTHQGSGGSSLADLGYGGRGMDGEGESRGREWEERGGQGRGWEDNER